MKLTLTENRTTGIVLVLCTPPLATSSSRRAAGLFCGNHASICASVLTAAGQHREGSPGRRGGHLVNFSNPMALHDGPVSEQAALATLVLFKWDNKTGGSEV